ncbi:hypothetical protein CXB51_012659 [Gossypium anomalum]|uniref:DUF4283 domain-containing protein n=1 Tax=Gossypium anomalum TaxID=47600 RepID=A0A8J5Z2S4_9ROSI|nr:hypothetical protein CXB51_012659 [Gossypium anomalum]
MRNTLANLWYPLGGLQISEKQYLFRFYNKVDIDKVVKCVPWAFNNHLLVFHRLENNEDPMPVPLIYSWFWVQVHDLPPGFFRKQWQNRLVTLSEHLRICLGHGGSFCPIRLNRDFKETEIGWDISLRAPTRRASTTTSLWLWEDNEAGISRGILGMRSGEQTQKDKISSYKRETD